MIGSCTSLYSTKSVIVEKDHEKEKKLEGFVQTETSSHTLLKTFLTLCIYAVFYSLSLCTTLFGPSLVHMVELYGTDISRMSITLTCGACGYLAGAILCGVVYERYNYELQFFLTCFLMGLTTAILPWMPSLYTLYVFAALQNISMGYIDASAQSYIIHLWMDHRFKQPVIQGLHAMWTFAGVSSSLIVRPFLVQLPENEVHKYMENNSTTSSMLDEDFIDDLSRVRYPFGIAGITACSMSLLFLGAFIYMNLLSLKLQNVGKRNLDSKGKTINKKSAVIVWVILLFCFCFFNIWFGKVTGEFLSAFAIQGLHWPAEKGALVSSVYWISVGTGRVLAVPLSIILKPFPMLCLSLSLTIISLGIMILIHASTEIGMWIATAMVGFFLASVFASFLSYISIHVAVTGGIAAGMFTGISFGAMAGATLTGYLFNNYTHMWVIYLSMISCISQLIILIIMFVFTKWMKSKSLKMCPDSILEVKPIKNHVNLVT